MKRNLTVQLDEGTIKDAKIVAVRRSMSLSHLLREEIKKLANQESDYERAKRAALDQLSRPFHLGGGSLPTRDSLHER